MAKKTLSISIEPTGINEDEQTAFTVFTDGDGGGVINGSKVDAMLLVLSALKTDLDIPEDLWSAVRTEIAKLD
jgi:hypothetical protein